MTVQTQDQSIWQWKNTAHITKTAMEFGFAIAAILMAGTAIYTAAKGVALSSALPAFLANPWVMAAIVSYVAIYFVARSISSYQQMHSMEGAQGKAGENGENGENGKNADFSALDTIKGGTISFTQTADDKGCTTQQLSLKLSKDGYDALVANAPVGTVIALYVLLPGKKEAVKVQFKHEAASKPEDQNRTVTLTHVGDNDLAVTEKMTEVRKALEMETVSTKNVALSNQDLKAISTNLVSTVASNVAAQVASK